MDAKQAKALTDKANSQGMNYQVKHILDKIEREASIGKRHIVLDDPMIHLYEEDYKTLEALGYTCKRAENKIYCPKDASSSLGMTHMFVYGIISWG